MKIRKLIVLLAILLLPAVISAKDWEKGDKFIWKSKLINIEFFISKSFWGTDKYWILRFESGVVTKREISWNSPEYVEGEIYYAFKDRIGNSNEYFNGYYLLREDNVPKKVKDKIDGGEK